MMPRACWSLGWGILGVLACSKPAPPVEPAPAPAPPPIAAAPVDAAPVQPDVCHANIAWRAGRFEIVGLPCILRDGSQVLYAKLDERPPAPELAVIAATRDDRLAQFSSVMERSEAGELLDRARRPTPELDQRIVKANVMLTEAAKHAVPLAPLAATRAGTHAGQGIELAWTERAKFTISREGRFLHGGDLGKWVEQGSGCPASSYLEQVWGDAARGVLLIKMANRGTGASNEACAGLASFHVISWTP